MSEEKKQDAKDVIQQHIVARLSLLPAGESYKPAEIASWLFMPRVIERTICESSNVASYGYHALSRTLSVQFSNGAEYRYLNVPKVALDDLDKAMSKGSALAVIKRMFKAVKVVALEKD